MTATHFTAWLTTDPSALSGENCDVTVLADDEVGERDGQPVWSSVGNPLFYTEVTARHDADDDSAAIEQAKEALEEAGWRIKGDWDAVTTGSTVEVTLDPEAAERHLRTVRGVLGPQDSDIDDTTKRDTIVAAVEAGHVHRESRLTGEGPADFLRVVEYDDPATGLARFALHREQGDGLSYISDLGNRALVEIAYEYAIRELATDSDYDWDVTDVPLPTRH